MSKIKKGIFTEIAVSVGLVCAIMFSGFSDFQKGCDDIKSKVLRLHIIAASDEQEDQLVKLSVRDAVLNAGRDIFENSLSRSDAEKAATEKKDYLTDIANAVLRENGMSYTARIEIGNSRFPTKSYGSFTLPAGEYRAVRVILGEGKGHNWWCVMFPPLCLPAAEGGVEPEDVLNSENMKIVSANPKYEIRFKIVEWYENIKSRLREKS